MRCPRCGAGLPAGSRFCNACGASLTPHPAGGTVMPVQPRPIAPTAPAAPAGFAVMPAAPRRPVGLLILILAILTACIGAGALAVSGKLKLPVLGARGPETSSGSPVAQGSTPDLPGGPSAVAGRPVAPFPGAPVHGGRGSSPDMAPPVTGMATSPRPGGASVVSSATNPALPAGPSPIASSPSPQAPGPNPTAQVPGMRAPQQPPPDNSDFDRYLRWLQFIENERAGLRAQGETEAFRVIDSFYQAALQLADPYSNDVQVQQQFDQGMQLTLQRALRAAQVMRNNLRTHPPVPPDCRALHQFYTTAAAQEADQTALLLDALARKDIGRVRSVGRSGMGMIDRNLGQANLELERVYKGRGLNPQFRIETGGNSSMLGGMLGLGGLR